MGEPWQPRLPLEREAAGSAEGPRQAHCGNVRAQLPLNAHTVELVCSNSHCWVGEGLQVFMKILWPPLTAVHATAADGVVRSGPVEQAGGQPCRDGEMSPSSSDTSEDGGWGRRLPALLPTTQWTLPTSLEAGLPMPEQCPLG